MPARPPAARGSRFLGKPPTLGRMKTSEKPPGKDEVDAVIRQYGTVPYGELPGWLRNPQGRHQFDLGFAMLMCRRPEWGDSIYPMYDDGVLFGWHGVRLRR